MTGLDRWLQLVFNCIRNAAAVGVIVSMSMHSSCSASRQVVSPESKYGSVQNFTQDEILSAFLSGFPQHILDAQSISNVVAVIVIPSMNMRRLQHWVIRKHGTQLPVGQKSGGMCTRGGSPPMDLESDRAVTYLCHLHGQEQIDEELPDQRFQCFAVYLDSQWRIIGFKLFMDYEFASTPQLEDTVDNNGQQARKTRARFFEFLRKVQYEAKSGVEKDGIQSK